MSNTKKKTKKEYFEQIKANYNLTEDEVEFIDHEIELLDRKNASGGDRKPTKAQEANEAIKTEILDSMTPNRLYTISEMLKVFACCSDLSQNKVNALVKQLKDEGKVVRTEDKGKAYFTKAD
jgi:hypothetical protein